MARLSARHCKRPYRSPTHILSTTYKKVSRLRAINKELQDGEKQQVEVNMYRASNYEIMRKFSVDL